MIRVDRISREGVVVHKPKLTLGLTIQPAVLEAFRSEARLRGLGLYGRFWWCVPKSNIGSRVIDPPQIANSVRRDYQRAVRDTLMPEQGQKALQTLLQLSPDARQLLRDFERELEPRLGPGGDLAHRANGPASSLDPSCAGSAYCTLLMCSATRG